MAAGLGSKTFTTGEVLTSADVNGYLMQGVLVFASAAARNAAITSPQEGQYAYLKDTNVTYYYDGAAWIVSDATGMANPMTTTGDVIYSSSGTTPARLGIGTALQVLRTNSGATAPEWAAAAAGGKLLQVVNATTTTLTQSSSSTLADTTLTATITPTLNTSKILVIVSQNGCRKDSQNTYAALKLFRGATEILKFAGEFMYTGDTSSINAGGPGASYLDSPATTSATTYKTQFSNEAATGTISVQSTGTVASSITLMEIGA